MQPTPSLVLSDRVSMIIEIDVIPPFAQLPVTVYTSLTEDVPIKYSQQRLRAVHPVDNQFVWLLKPMSCSSSADVG